jgi:hypothetical protein
MVVHTLRIRCLLDNLSTCSFFCQYPFTHRHFYTLPLYRRSHRSIYGFLSAYSTAAAIGMSTVNTTTRLDALRRLMQRKENDVTAYVVPSEDQRECTAYRCWHMFLDSPSSLF